MKPLTPATPHVIVMMGIPSSGKTTFAEHLAKTFQSPIVSVEHIAREAEIDSVSADRVALHFLTELYKTKRTIVYDGYTDTKVSRVELMKQITKAGYHPVLVWVQTELLESKRRALKRRPDGGELTSEEFDSIVRHFTAAAPNEKPIVISGRHTYSSQLKVVLKHLAREPQPILPTPPRPQPSGRNIIIR